MGVFLSYMQSFMKHLMAEMQGLGFSNHVWANIKELWKTD